MYCNIKRDYHSDKQYMGKRNREKFQNGSFLFNNFTQRSSAIGFSFVNSFDNTVVLLLGDLFAVGEHL